MSRIVHQIGERMQSGRPTLRGTAIGALAIAVLAVANGCGSSSKPLTPAQLTARADAICKRVTAKLKAAGSSVNTPEELKHRIESLSTFEQDALGELSALVPPESLEADWKRFVAGAQTLAEDTAKLSTYLNAKATAQVKAVIASTDATQRQMIAIAKRDGWTACKQQA